ncbi:MAG: acyl-CoA dehydrogenase family protein [Ilumatobacteraceae bacterium]
MPVRHDHPDDVDPFAHIREGVRRTIASFDDAYWRAKEAAHEFPMDFYEVLAAGGWIGIAIPEEYGGGGQGITEASVMLEEIAASGAGMNGASAVHLSIFGMNPVVKHGSEEMRRTYLPAVADGSLHVAFGVTEPDAGTDTTAISTFARRTDGGYLVRGRKVWTTKASLCQKVLLLVRTTPLADVQRRTDGMTLLLADLQRPAVDIVAIPKMARNAVVSCEVRYDDLFVADSDRIGEEGKGFSYLLDGLNPERILIAAEQIGIGRRAIQRAVEYANERVVFGRPIGMNQAISHPLAACHAKLRAAELAVRSASERYDRGLPCAEDANIAKYLAAEASFAAADQALQTHGGMGYAIEYDVERYFREARLARLAPISQEMVLNYLAEHVLGLPRSY